MYIKLRSIKKAYSLKSFGAGGNVFRLRFRRSILYVNKYSNNSKVAVLIKTRLKRNW